MNSAVRWATFVGVLVAALVVAYGAYALAGTAWDAVVDYRSLYVEQDVPDSPVEPAVSRRVVLVIADGLGLDAAREMVTLNRLGDSAADFVLTAPQPSLSYPNWTTILSGAPPYVSGVVTNWHEGPAPVETILDSADRADVPYVVIGPTDIAELYPAASKAEGTFFREWSDDYLSATYVDAAVSLVAEKDPRLVVLHLPDIDEAGHGHGGASGEYAEAVSKVDDDLRRLVEALQDGETTFVVVADHGHIDTGGHGGWEDAAVQVRGVFGGAGVNLMTGAGALEDVAPTIAVLAGVPIPGHSAGEALYSVIATSSANAGIKAAKAQREGFAVLQVDTMLGPDTDAATRAEILALTGRDSAAGIAAADETRQAQDRAARLPYGAAMAGAALLVIAIVGLASWRALVASSAGVLAYYAVYNALFFIVHGNEWSLSSFNSEDLIESWMNQRMIEAALAGLVAAAVAALVYPVLRQSAKGPKGSYLAGWLTLGPTAALLAQATLALQAAWFVWWWGVTPVWRLPDLKWGFKFDLDLVQMTALGAAAVIAPVVTYLVGRYHPKVRAAEKTAD